MAVRLVFLTNDPKEIQLATRYWATDEAGGYLEKVRDLVPFRDLQRSGMLSTYVRQYCVAYDENQRCKECGSPVVIVRRNEPKKGPQVSERLCPACDKHLHQNNARIKQDEKFKLRNLLGIHLKRVKSKTISYDGLPDDVCLILIAVDMLISPRLSNGTFKEHNCEELAPNESRNYIRRLYENGIVVDDPRLAINGAYFVENEDLKFHFDKVAFFLPPDKDLGRGEDALKKITKREFTNAKVLTGLWLDYAVGDTIRYLIDQCIIYNFVLEFEQFEKIKGVVRHALCIYSVSQVWYVIWKAVLEASSLVSRQYYNRTKAVATIPNKIRRQFERAEQGNGIDRCWARPKHHIVGSLGMVFLKVFEINEYTPGSQVIRNFSMMGRDAVGEIDYELQLLAMNFMRDAVAGGNALMAIEKFADLIRAGYQTKSALEAVMVSESS